MGEWQPIETAPRDGMECLFYSPGKKSAGNENARDPHIHVDLISDRWQRSRHQYPEAPYTHWMPLPDAPARRQSSEDGR